jgi:hypothetical protein
MTREEGIARMKEAAGRRTLPQLAMALQMLEAKPKLDDAERLTRTVIIDVICERCPEADAAFDAWADSDNTNATEPIVAIIAMARTPARRPGGHPGAAPHRTEHRLKRGDRQ